jgi:hypothetical protein
VRGNSFVPFMLKRGDGSTLSLDFTRGVLDSRITFTRASTTGSGSTTYINSSGLVTTATTNEARFDYDPSTLTPRGLLIEGSSTNLFSYSEDFSNAAWTKASVDSTMPLTGTSPKNDSTSRLLQENTTSYAKHSLERSISITAGVHTVSAWLKEPSSNSRRYVHVQLADGQATAARYTVVFDLQTGTVTASGSNNGSAGAPTNTAHSITAFPNGWYRISVTMNHVASPSYPTIVLGDSSALFGGNNQPFYSAASPYKGMLVWGAQLETGSGASSYIATGASTATRAADFAVMNDISSIGFSTSGGTMLMSGYQTKAASGSYPAIVAFLDASDVDVFGVRNDVAGAVLFGRFAGTSTSAEATRTISSNAAYRFGMVADPSLTTGAITVSMNGSSITANKVGTATSITTPTKFAITRPGYGAFINCGTIRSIKYWPTIKTAAELNGLTA